MIAVLTEQLNNRIILIYNNRVPAVILNEQAMFIKSGSRIFLRLPHMLKWIKKEEIIDGADLIIGNDKNEICTIRFCADDPGWNIFCSYEAQNGMISIGSSEHDDIYISDARIIPSQIQINLDTNQISDVLESGISSLNSVPIKIEKLFSTGDVFHLLNLQILFGREMIRVNSCQNNCIHVPIFQRKNNDCSIDSLQNQLVKRNSRNHMLHDHYAETLEEPIHLDSTSSRPLILSMGPAMTMAMASAASGSFAVYNGYLNGRELIDLIPMILLPCVLLVSTLIWMPASRIYERIHLNHQKKKRIRNYSNYLNEVANRIDQAKSSYRNDAEILFHTDILDLANVYQKTANHEDFGCILLGSGTMKFKIDLKKDFRLSSNDPVHQMIDSMIHRLNYIEQAPIILSLVKNQKIILEITSEVSTTFFSILQQATAFHGPDIMQIAILADEEWIEQRYWIRLIPHIKNETSGMRMIASSRQRASVTAKEFSECSKALNLVFVQNQSFYSESEWDINHTSVVVNPKHQPADADYIRIVWSDRCYVESSDSRITFEPSESLNVTPYEYFGRLSTYKIAVKDERMHNANPSFFDLMNVSAAKDLQIECNWNSNLSRNGVKTTIGLDDDGEPIALDLHEHGHGPHGMIAGCTGSGKSILLITILLGLSINYSLREVRFVIIDFKGGGVSQVFKNQNGSVPHLSGVISNLEEGRCKRTMVSFSNECRDREKLFQELSIFASTQIMSIDDYQISWQEESGLPYLSHLLIVVDEFAELKREYPDFLNDLVSLARVGRSLGIHLILATQKPSGIVNDQIWSNSRFKICLKVQEKQDSMEMLHRPDASKINKPGRFCFLYDDIMQKGQAGYVNAPLNAGSSVISIVNADGSVEISSHQTRINKTQASAAVNEIIKVSSSFHCDEIDSLWLDELRPIHINQINCHHGVAIGQIDDYYHRSQPFLYLNEEIVTNTAVFSMNRSEKIKFLNTLMYSVICDTEAADEIYLLDDLNYDSEILLKCPQMIAVFNASNQELLLNMISHLLDRSSGSQSRAFVIIDDFASLPAENNDWYNAMHALLEGAEKRNISVIVMANNCSGIPYRLLSLMPERISLFNDNLQDLSQIFECNVKETVSQFSFGMIKRDNLLQFRIADTDSIAIQELINLVVRKYGTEKKYILPSIPEYLKAEDCDEPGLVLGMGMQSYKWVCISEKESILILATYEEELYEITDRFSRQHKNILFNPNDEEFISNLNQFQNIIVMTLDHFQHSVLSRTAKITGILYIGTGFSDQYRFTIRNKTDLRHDQGVLYQKGRNQVIKLAL